MNDFVFIVVLVLAALVLTIIMVWVAVHWGLREYMKPEKYKDEHGHK